MKVYQTNEIKNIADLLPQKTLLVIISLLNKSMVTPFSPPFST